ncbi:hypothetical protein [Planosporangium mesophilum]|uniref:Uncharacterized protein n=1 Tax=Planosporangium mesophilum TaxID=689768 RepID=A0A8J3X129_9ACTN|nr:hypothetical protein [Planosporangium mesophilum]NJC81801.1 hypothetical protein [Planosporangium mesophilum]GII20538.1 hypothetical protein Pme01_01350 [Planosporangium mesophilum]
MRRVGLVAAGVWVAVFGLVTPAVAEPSPTAAATGAGGENVCTLTDSRLTGLTGLVALDDGGYAAVNSVPDQQAGMRIFYLDSKCKLSRSVPYGNNPARDPQDLAVASDGALWVADTGDNTSNKAERRDTIALWRVPPGGGNPVIHRLSYPDGAHDARAVLFGPDDTPVIVTKESSGTAAIYQPSEPLQANNRQGVPLKKVGTWQPKRTNTPNFLSVTGRVLVTGAARSPDRKRIALRTYSDAYEWDVPDGDVVKALTTGKPRLTTLTGADGQGEANGEALAYSADGKSFLTTSGQAGIKIQRYKPASTPAEAVPVAGSQADKPADTRSWFQKFSLSDLVYIVAGVGVLGLLLAVIGVIGIRRSRKARRAAAAEAGPAETPGKGGGGPQKGGGGPRPPAPNAPPAFPDAGPPAFPDPRRQQGRVVVGPPAPPPVDPRAGGRRRPHPGQGPADGGRVYGGRPHPQAGYEQPGFDRRTGPQQYSQPGYHPDYGDGRY